MVHTPACNLAYLSLENFTMATSTAAAAPQRTSATDKSRRWKTLKSQLPNYLFILPHFVLFTLFLLYPIFRGLQISLFDLEDHALDAALAGPGELPGTYE